MALYWVKKGVYTCDTLHSVDYLVLFSISLLDFWKVVTTLVVNLQLLTI